MKKYNLAVIGARGAVGKEMVNILDNRKELFNEVRVLHSGDSKSYYRDDRGFVHSPLTKDSFKDVDISLFAHEQQISKKFVPTAIDSGSIAIDNSSYFRMWPDVPLVVPEVNAEDLLDHANLIANPNCSTIQMVVALKPLHDFAKIKRIVVSTYQSVSGAGRKGIEELEKQSVDPGYKHQLFSRQIAFNVIPEIDVMTKDGYTREELKMVNETKKILHEDINVTATCVRVPVYYGHCESVNIETEKKITRDEALQILNSASGVEVIDDLKDKECLMPVDVYGKDSVFVSRIREDNSIENGLNLWIVADNVRKGAALNAVQIAEEIIKNDLI